MLQYQALPKTESLIGYPLVYDPVYKWSGNDLNTCAQVQFDPKNHDIDITVKPTVEYG